MNGTVNPLYGGNNMNGGAAVNPVNALLNREELSNIKQQNKIYQGQETANRISQRSLVKQPTRRAEQYDSLSNKIQEGVKGTAETRPMEAMLTNSALNMYRKTPGVDSVGKVFAGVTKDIKQTSNITSDKITSIIFTVMQALSNSFTGGMNGMKAELEKISKDQEDSDDNAMVEFLKDCGSFLNFFIQYTTVNKQLQYKITHPDDDDLLAPQQKAYIKGIKKKLDGETNFNNVAPYYDNKQYKNNKTLQKEIEGPTTYFYDVTKNPPKWVEYTGVINNKITNEEKEQIKKDLLKQRKQYLKKLNNIELEFYQEKLNNAFQYLTFTYGQLSGRTLYNLSKLLAAGGAKDVGLFAPISLGSLSGSAVRMVPGAGPVLDTINDFFSAFTMAFKMSYKTLKQERDLASDYIDTTAKESNEKLRKLQTGGSKFEYIDKNTFKKITGKKEDREVKNKNFNVRAKNISNDKGDHRLSKGDGRVFSKAKAESDLEMLNQILYDYNHLMSLKKLFNRLKYERYLGKYRMLRTEQIYNTGEDRNYYIGEEKKNDKIKKINKEELKALNSNDELKEKFGELVTLLDGLGGNVDSNEKKSDESPIEINNPMLYNIVKQFIKTTYEGLGIPPLATAIPAIPVTQVISGQGAQVISGQGAQAVPFGGGGSSGFTVVTGVVGDYKKRYIKEQEKKYGGNGILFRLLELIELIDSSFYNNIITQEIDKKSNQNIAVIIIEKFLKKQENKEQDKQQTSTDKQENDKTDQIKTQIVKLKKIIEDENKRIDELNKKREGDQGKGKNGKANQERIREMIERQKELLNKNLDKYRAMEIQAINDEIVASNSFKPLKKLLSKYRSTLKTKIQEMISALKSNDNMYNTDKVVGTGNMIGFDRKTQLETDKLIRSALEKILNFIAIKNFKAFNEAASKIESGAKTLMSSGGSMRTSTIKRRIKKATRRIQLSLDEFNSGRNTRRGGYRNKPRKTRRVNYGH